MRPSEVSDPRYERLAERIAGELKLSPRRTGLVLGALQRRGLPLARLEQAIFAPREPLHLATGSKVMGGTALRTRFIAPTLRALRGKRTLADTARLLEVRNLSTLHHWESGRRDLPFSRWLQAVDLCSGRLDAVVECLPFRVELETLGFEKGRTAMMSEFFADVWTPVVLLSLRLPEVRDLPAPAEQVRHLTLKLGATAREIEDSAGKLLRLGLARLEEGRLVADPAQFYAIPSVPAEEITRIQQHWFSQAEKFSSRPVFHKVEQHALSRASRDRIVGWITELRERIRVEVRDGGEPETLIHINWQVAELI